MPIFAPTWGVRSRPLTAGEITTARQVFGNQIDYGKVRINEKPRILTLLTGTNSITPNGEIYLPTFLGIDDLSSEPARAHIFMHEMTHVWQYQNGRSIVGEALMQMVKARGNYGSPYFYKMDRGADFHKMNLEQQAQIIGDFSFLKQRNFWGDEWHVARYEDFIKAAGFPIATPDVSAPRHGNTTQNAPGRPPECRGPTSSPRRLSPGR